MKVDDAELTKLASAGVTSVLALPSGDVISGQSALVNVVAPPDEPQIGNIVEARRGLVVVKSPVALHVSFPDRPRVQANAYPESLMGVIAFVRQAFLDAQHYGVDASGTDDPALEAMQPAVDRKMPVAFEANAGARDPARAEDGEGAEARADRHRRARGRRGDRRSEVAERARDLQPELPDAAARARRRRRRADQRAARSRARRRRSPARLRRPASLFAFASAGLADPKDFVKNAAKAVKAGLAEDAAIRALTINAATIAGVGDRLGSIEKGKAANLVVTDGNLFDEKTKITRVFVDGRPVALEAPAAPAGRGRGGAITDSAAFSYRLSAFSFQRLS